MKEYRIYPSVGVARLGNSEQDYFVGPEAPGVDFTPPPNGLYRGADDKIRRQAARFRIFEITCANPAYRRKTTQVREITDAEAEIEWHVNLANRKSFFRDGRKEVNDPGVHTVKGANDQIEVMGSAFGASVSLGTLRTEANASLLVLGGYGKSASPLGLPLNSLFNAGWYDDVSDGPVRATLRFRGTGETPRVEPAWVVVGVPRYAAPLVNIVTLWDLAFQAATELPPHLRLNPPRPISFTRDIYPMLFRPVFMQWASATARSGHGTGRGGDFLEPGLFDLLKDNNPDPGSAARQAREHVFSMLANPAGGGGTMPLLNGGLTVTRLQYTLFDLWAEGDFIADWPQSGPLPPPPFGGDLLAGLDLAAMGSCVGGSFFPGIETGNVVAQTSTWESPFRISRTLLPGALTAQLSVPWQADYTACGSGWWPGGRPETVTNDGTSFYSWVPSGFSMDDMVQKWWQLGFLAWKEGEPVGTSALETERLLP